ncbi:ATP-binding protein [Pseudothauera nasutitermitis]|uniref:ATP-binding protein n=1 Tax=Pseudothauera nasutitermitis TaxID=2565930 RepID=A0A4S4AQH7_9RHOO|nr:ATP-binding protein [Pseudothauera nasutitermitis]THF61522.1 ATP-binding protein [Pseudothauera nasutitermitis]
MYSRTLAQTLYRVSDAFPVLMLTGPRQVGKTTLLEMCARDAPRRYVTLDDLDARALAQSDPALFLQTWPAPVIIDEIQYAPQLFPAIKLQVDRDKANGLFWLTGSQKFELMRGITETLAGRVAIVDLLGLSQAELLGRGDESRPFVPTADWIAQARQGASPQPLSSVFERIWLGSYPRLNTQGAAARDVFYRSYVQTYIQRDVQDVLKISDQTAFHRFLTAVAARTGQLLNYSSLARDVDVDSKTTKAWLAVLETCGLVYLLQPWHSNLTKRLVKAPKLYFLDTGLAAYLTRWPDAASLEAGAMSGAMLETWVVSEVLKSYWHNGLEAPLYFYRDADQQEVDLLVDSATALHPVEIKKTASPSHNAKRHFTVLDKLNKPVGPGAVICFVERDIPLSRAVTAIPIAYL